MHSIASSFRALPAWVRIWVLAVLVPVNIAPLFFLGHPLGQYAALASAVVAMFNLPIIWIERGFSRALSLPHLLAWLPLLAWILHRGVCSADDPLPIRWLGVSLLLVNGVSVHFDVLDSVRWWRGERAIFGSIPVNTNGTRSP